MEILTNFWFLHKWLIITTSPILWFTIGAGLAKLHCIWFTITTGNNPYLIGGNNRLDVSLAILATLFWPVTLIFVLGEGIFLGAALTAILGSKVGFNKLVWGAIHWVANWDTTTNRPRLVRGR